ncbi:nuclear transport factor 2 family protein [Streptomyces mirabilis]|uniref:nuclear transport factor 2 family protein n=1 Tax=Streptomyces mirabilis TaxID=68239 RepID=UPI0036B9A102
MEQHTAQSADAPPAWLVELYAPMEKMDPEGFLGKLSEDVTLRLGNGAPVVGHEAIRAGSPNFFGAIRSMTHEFSSVWTCGEDTMAAGEAVYNMADGDTIRVPFATLVHRRGDGLVDRMQTFIDVGPVVAALPGRH